MRTSYCAAERCRASSSCKRFSAKSTRLSFKNSDTSSLCERARVTEARRGMRRVQCAPQQVSVGHGDRVSVVGRIHQRLQKLWGGASPVAGAKPRRALYACRSNGAPPKHQIVLIFDSAQAFCQTLRTTHRQTPQTHSSFFHSLPQLLLTRICRCLSVHSWLSRNRQHRARRCG